MRSFVPPLLVAAFLCSCQGVPDGWVESCEDELSLPPGISTDILFVIDDSGSMTEEQEKVVAELETFVAALLEGPVENDFQVGVVTTSVTSNALSCFPESEPDFRRYTDAMGRLQPGKDEEGFPLEGPRLLRWTDANFLEDFRRLVTQGIEGSGQEMGFEAMRLALSEPLVSTDNKGFLRPGSRLLVILISDEDDCSDPSGTTLALKSACERIVCASDADCAAGNYCLPDGDERSCQPNTCETEEGRAALEPVKTYVDFLRNLDDGTGIGRKRETFLAVIGPMGLEPPHEPARCSNEVDEAWGVGVRYREAVELMGENAYVDSICSESYGTALRKIAELASAPHVLTLPRSPEDGRLLVVDIHREGGEPVRCRMGDGFSFEPPTSRTKARLTLEGQCRLRHGDRIELKVFCAG